MTICTAYVFLGQMLFPKNVCTTATWSMFDTPLRALFYSTLRYIEYTHDYIHYVCISGPIISLENIYTTATWGMPDAPQIALEHMYDSQKRPIMYTTESPIWYDCHMRPIRYACESARIYKIYVTASWYTPPRALHYISLSHERPIRYASQSLIRFLTFFLSFFLSSFLSLRQVYVRHGYVCIWLILWMMRDMMQWYERHDSWERERERSECETCVCMHMSDMTHS